MVISAQVTTSQEPLSDEEVVARVLAGETGMFEIVMRRHNQRLYRVARALLRNDGEAEDVMQDAYVRAYEHLDQFAGKAKFSTWLTRIAVHEALARQRRGNRYQELEPMSEREGDPMDRFASLAPDPEQQASNSEVRQLAPRLLPQEPGTSDSFVFFGATGDLAYKQIFPALQQMILRDNFNVPIVGVAKSGWTIEQLQARVRDSLTQHGGIDEKAYTKLVQSLQYIDGDYQDPKTFEKLTKVLGEARSPLHIVWWYRSTRI